MDEVLKKIIEESNSICFMTGAGISIASGIPDFRSSKGIYNMNYHYSPERILSRSFYLKNPKEFYDFYFKHMLYPQALPNDTHKAIAMLEKKGKKVTVITQNIDGLHQLAGSSEVLELHGSVHRNHCLKCHRFYNLEDLMKLGNPPKCECSGLVKPDVVLYEEGLDMDLLYRAIEAIEQCDALIVCGTSLVVNPAASLVRYYHGNKFVIINMSSTPYDNLANLVINEPAENVLKYIIDK